MVEGLGALAGGEVVSKPILNQGLVRFSRPGASDLENDRCTVDVTEAINESGEAFFSGSVWNGRRVMRVSVVNWQTSDADVRRAIQAAATVLETL